MVLITVQMHAFAAELPADQTFGDLDGAVLRLSTDERMHPAAVALAWHRDQRFGKLG